MFDFIITDGFIGSPKFVSDLNWKNVAGTKTENSF